MRCAVDVEGGHGGCGGSWEEEEEFTAEARRAGRDAEEEAAEWLRNAKDLL